MNQRDLSYAKWSAIAGAIFIVVAAASDFWPAPNALKWSGFREAQEMAASRNKPIFVDVYANWCSPCRQMDRQVFPDDSVKAILADRYVLAKINGDDPAEGEALRQQFGIRAYPTYIVLSPAGKERKRHIGFFPKTALLRWLTDSAGVQILLWPEFEKALTVAGPSHRRVMVLILQSGDDIEAANAVMEDEVIASVVEQHFVPTLLVRGNSGEDKLMEKIGASPKTGMREIIVLNEQGKEVGRFFVSLQMQFNHSQLAAKLFELASK